MRFLNDNDYKRVIRDTVLTQVIAGDRAQLTSAELASQQEISSYLAQRYDVSLIFSPVLPWDSTVTYIPGQGVTYPIQVLDDAGAGEYLWYIRFEQGGSWYLYLCIASSYLDGQNPDTHPAKFRRVADASETEPSYFTNIGAGAPYDSRAWLPGDPRQPIITMYMVDCVLYHLHSRLAPGQIPQTRVDRYADAIAWLTKVSRGEIPAPGLPLLTSPEADPVSFGSNSKKSHFI